MKEKFILKKIDFDNYSSTGILSIKKLCKLIDNHPYKSEIYSAFNIEKIKNEHVKIGNIDILFNKVNHFSNKYDKFKIYAYVKDISLFEEEKIINGTKEKVILFQFDEFIEIDEVKQNLKAISIYNSKNTFLDEYEMTKYANNLFKRGFPDLARVNIDYFKDIAKNIDDYNKYRCYRLVKYDNNIYLRGITSEKYNEYGVDFTFVISMLLFHKYMKKNKGNSYSIIDASVNESKLEFIVKEKKTTKVKSFGDISTSIRVSTNDLGQGSLNFLNIINVAQNQKDKGFFLYQKTTRLDTTKMIITHTSKPKKVFEILENIDPVLETSEEFIDTLNDLKTIKTPDELRSKILLKIKNPRSPFKNLTNLTDIFKRKIDNEINNFSKLIEMCSKAERLDLEFDLKDKLRYIISDIILYGSTK